MDRGPVGGPGSDDAHPDGKTKDHRGRGGRARRHSAALAERRSRGRAGRRSTAGGAALAAAVAARRRGVHPHGPGQDRAGRGTGAAHRRRREEVRGRAEGRRSGVPGPGQVRRRGAAPGRVPEGGAGRGGLPARCRGPGHGHRGDLHGGVLRFAHRAPAAERRRPRGPGLRDRRARVPGARRRGLRLLHQRVPAVVRAADEGHGLAEAQPALDRGEGQERHRPGVRVLGLLHQAADPFAGRDGEEVPHRAGTGDQLPRPHGHLPGEPPRAPAQGQERRRLTAPAGHLAARGADVLHLTGRRGPEGVGHPHLAHGRRRVHDRLLVSGLPAAADRRDREVRRVGHPRRPLRRLHQPGQRACEGRMAGRCGSGTTG